ncbi:MAG: putative metal-binding motif-containing protein [Bacteroidetes bacterium]|nr:putative metal-binding motif-containing protein [Bacteroidota bacterium]
MKIFAFLAAVCFVSIAFSQAPAIQWQNTIGGDSSDWGHTVIKALDGGFYLGGGSKSDISGDKSENIIGDGYDFYDWDCECYIHFNAEDYWLVKTDVFGNVEWDLTIGGDGLDAFTSLQQTPDGGLILGGISNSDISGNKSENSWGDSYDYWVVKLDSNHNIIWQNTIGGIEDDYLSVVQFTADGGYILGGQSDSDSTGDKTENRLGACCHSDMWIVKLKPDGEIEWQNTIGGDNFEALGSISQTSDGGYIISGSSQSDISFDKTENSNGGTDYWIVKLDSLGEVEWDKTIGGENSEIGGQSIQTFDGGYFIFGSSNSEVSGDKNETYTGEIINYDFWVIKLNSDLIIEWQNTIGGISRDILYTGIQTIDGGYLIAGNTSSPISGDKTESNIGEDDIWIINLDSVGNILWQNIIGGVEDDFVGEIIQIEDNGYILNCTSNSPISGDKAESNSDYDYWVIKLSPPCDTLFTEECNGYDDNCNGIIDEGFSLYTLYMDNDDDNFGNPGIEIISCLESITGYVTDNSDCNDSDSLIFPGSPEICNNIDDNCNLFIDEGLPENTFFQDADGDLYGNILIDTISCSDLIPGFVSDNTDCDDTNPLIYPGALNCLMASTIIVTIP